MTEKKLILFDFDGTLTHADSAYLFFSYAFGSPKMCCVWSIMMPLYLMMLCRCISVRCVTELTTHLLFKGRSITDIKELGENFSREIIPSIIDKETLDILTSYKKEGHKVVIVSASFDIWLDPWCKEHNIDLVSTKLEHNDGKYTGKLLNNEVCSDQTKVDLVKREVPDWQEYKEIVAYGDSRGDHEMLRFARSCDGFGYIKSKSDNSFRLFHKFDKSTKIPPRSVKPTNLNEKY